MQQYHRDHHSYLPYKLLLKSMVSTPIPRSDEGSYSFRGTWGAPRPTLQDYSTLALTCRSVNRLATHVLYRRYDHEQSQSTLAKIIVAILNRPELSAMVKEVKEIGQRTELKNLELRLWGSCRAQAMCSVA
jgi:hypothetical protein